MRVSCHVCTHFEDCHCPYLVHILSISCPYLVHEAVEPADLYKVEAQVIRESVANRMFKRLRRVSWQIGFLRYLMISDDGCIDIDRYRLHDS